MTPFIHLTQKDQPFSWGVEAENAFQSLKASFITTPLLIHVDLSNPFILEMDTSDFASGVVFSQPREDNFFHLIGFCFCKFFLAKINYKIHDKGLLAIVDAFKEYRHLPKGAQHEIIMYSDHKNLQYFMTTRVLNRCQA